MIRCIAIDDEPMALEVIKAFCEKISFLHLSHTFTQVSAAQKHLKTFPVDLIFLDIQMPDLNGIDFYKNFKEDAMVIFTTAYSQYAVDAFNVNAVDYLLKPFEFTRFEDACNKTKDYLEFSKSKNSAESNSLLIRSEYALVKVPFSEILYLETLDDYIKIHQIGKKPILTLMSMKKMLEQLPEQEFIRVHRSYIVPLNKIESVRAKSISLGVIEIPIGTSYEKDFFRKYTIQNF
ncbi:MAG: LytR/AlgR family response regulator transcription factor [Bacteroidia bacterium]